MTFYSDGGPRNFYSRPCGRGDLLRTRGDVFLRVISTHAPAGGATADELAALHRCFISTHAPAGGATRHSLSRVKSWSRFLLTPLREGRLSWIGWKLRQNRFLLTPLREGRQQFSTSPS